MRSLNFTVISTQDGSATVNSSPIDASMMYRCSAESIATGTITGTIKLQASNDKSQSLGAGAAPSNWADIANTSQTISAAGVNLVPETELAFNWVRAVYTVTSVGTQTVTTVADSSGSLNSTYFLLDDAASAHKYYVWFNINSAGVDPAVAGRTAVPITGATNVSANTLAASIVTAVAALNGTNSFTAAAASAVVTITNKVVGKFTPAADGVAATGFAFATTADVGNITVNFKSIGF